MPKIELDLPELPKGWRYTGEYRVAKNGEHIAFLDDEGGIVYTRQVDRGYYTSASYFIIKYEPEVWVPRKGGDRYYFVNSNLLINSHVYNEDGFDRACLSCGNCFQTKEEAEEVAEKFKEVIDEHKRKC